MFPSLPPGVVPSDDVGVGGIGVVPFDGVGVGVVSSEGLGVGGVGVVPFDGVTGPVEFLISSVSFAHNKTSRCDCGSFPFLNKFVRCSSSGHRRGHRYSCAAARSLLAEQSA